MNVLIKLSPPHISLPIIYCVKRLKKEHTIQVPPPEPAIKKRATMSPNQPRISIYGFDLTPPATIGLETGKP